MNEYQIAWQMLKAYLDGKTERNSDNKFGKEVQEQIVKIEKLLKLPIENE